MKKLRITVDGKTYEVDVEVLADDDEASPAKAAPARVRSSAVAAPVAAPAKAAPIAAGAGDVPSPLAAVVVSIDAQPGTAVQAGDKLITLEAMKMNTIVSAPAAGTVGAVHVKPGDAVEEGQVLVSLS